MVFHVTKSIADVVFMFRPSPYPLAWTTPIFSPYNSKKMEKKFLQNQYMLGINMVVFNAPETISDVIFMSRPSLGPLALTTHFSILWQQLKI